MRGSHAILCWPIQAEGQVDLKKAIGFDGLKCGADAPVLGVTRALAKAGDMVSVDCVGISVLKAGGPIARGTRLITDANGDAVAAGATPANPFGRALHAAAAGEDIQFLFSR